ncbi:MAG: hypothetical protein HRU19_31435 [Pseudobacteriovorax sp.]|nr:hypothetical protein [Pseudobacteriovorax sp.]
MQISALLKRSLNPKFSKFETLAVQTFQRGRFLAEGSAKKLGARGPQPLAFFERQSSNLALTVSMVICYDITLPPSGDGGIKAD